MPCVSAVVPLISRVQTERQLVQVCQGATSKQEMIDYNVDQYKHMFIIARREFQKVIGVSNFSLFVER